VLIPYPNDARREQVPTATEMRSTWMSTSVQTLRARGHYDAYMKKLPEPHRDTIQSIVAGLWLPMDVVLAHYAACDALDLLDSEIIDMGRESSQRAHNAIFAVMVRVARGAGVTPWTSITHAQKLWQRTMSGGGGVTIVKLGPKEARFEMAGFPPARFRYVRIAVRGIAQGVVELFARTAFVRELPSICNDTTLAYRISWA
jgi:hypothetical protein